MKPEELRVTTIEKRVRESPDIYTLHFRDEPSIEAHPGQYMMTWIPGVDEVPMSLSGINLEGLNSVTVRIVGEATQSLCGLNPGDRMGLRGPLGKGFKIKGSKPLLIGGGTGIATLKPLVGSMINKNLRPTLVIGSKNVEQLIFREIFREEPALNLIEATDDGTCGYHGYATECAATIIDDGYDHIYTCGPELMMASIYRDAEDRGMPIQASLERYIKCAAGLCGSCAIGPYRVCADGPVFDTHMLRRIRDRFGVSRLDQSGKKIKVEH
jgi:dihydroorotate dehydrogenase electron transfer subunit